MKGGDKMKFYKLSEIASILDVSYQTVWRHVKAGKLKTVKVGTEHRVTKESFEAYLMGE